MVNEKIAFATKMWDSWDKYSQIEPASRANENLQIYLRILSRNLFEVQLSWLPIICGKKYKQFMSVLLKNQDFTTRFLVGVLSFFNKNSYFTLIYINNFGICVRSTEKLSTLLICIKKSLKLMLDLLKICEFTIRFSE